MRVMIKDYNAKNATFSSVIGGKKMFFYLSNRLNKTFSNSLDDYTLADFVITKKFRLEKGKKYYQVKYFTYIKNYKYNKVLFDHEKLKFDMRNFIFNQENFLVLDLEMTFPNYRQRNFVPEIIQYGYYLINSKGEVLNENGSYLETKNNEPLNKPTIKFLKLDLNQYDENKKPFSVFYNELKDLFKSYNLKVLVWGKNDIKAINYAYEIYKVKPITLNTDFVDLLQLHKDYFNLSNDLGLFNAYKTYYEEEISQIHHAKDDALITKKVFAAFKDYLDIEIPK